MLELGPGRVIEIRRWNRRVRPSLAVETVVHLWDPPAPSTAREEWWSRVLGIGEEKGLCPGWGHSEEPCRVRGTGCKWRTVGASSPEGPAVAGGLGGGDFWQGPEGWVSFSDHQVGLGPWVRRGILARDSHSGQLEGPPGSVLAGVFRCPPCLMDQGRGTDGPGT